MSGMWLQLDLSMGTEVMCSKDIGLHAQNLLTTLDLLVNIIGGDLNDYL